MGFNGALILLGALGVLPPTVSALLHNSSTLLLSMHSLTKLMDEEKTSELERTHTNGNRSIQ
jgi:cation transport ATPase